MAIHSTNLSLSLRDRLDLFFAQIGRGMNSYIESRTRRHQITALEAKSDAELAQMGITRDRIVHYVFRDLIWL